MLQIVLVLVIAGAIGIVASVAGIVFIEAAAALAGWQGRESFFLLFTPAIAGVALALIAKRLPDGFIGLSDMIVFVQRGGRRFFRHHIYSTLAALIALIGGASVGQYGPVAHLGGALGQLFRYLPPRHAAACGIAAAIAAAFNAPFTALIFAHEVVLRHYSLRAFTPVAISAVVGGLISAGLFNRPVFLEFPQMAAINPTLIILFIIMGALFGLLAYCYLSGIFFIADKSQRYSLIKRLPVAGLIAGVLAFYLPDIAGGGKALLQQSVTHLALIPVVMLLAAKLASTLICLGAGFAGGVVSPTLAIGALAGLLFFHIISFFIPALAGALPPSAVAVCGMMALTAPVIGAPLTAIFLTLELSGNYPVAVAATVAITVAVQTTAKLGGKSFYDMQLQRRGIDVNLRQDEWRLATDTVEALLVPAHSVAVTLPPQTALAAAIRCAIEQKHSDIYVVDEQGYFQGVVTLPAILNTDAVSLRHALADATEQPLVLSHRETVAGAMQKLENFVGSTIPVVKEDGRLAGALSEGSLLRHYNQQVRAYRQEETAVS